MMVTKEEVCTRENTQELDGVHNRQNQTCIWLREFYACFFGYDSI